MAEKELLDSERLEKAYGDFFKYQSNDSIDYTHRYSSWNICYAHFKNEFFIKPSPTKDDKRLAGLHLGFYLGSWGMFRNSNLLNYGIGKYEELAEKLYRLNVDSSDKDDKKKFVFQYDAIRLFLKKWNCDRIKKDSEKIKNLFEKIDPIKFDKNSIKALLEFLEEKNLDDNVVNKIVCEAEKIREDLNSKEYKKFLVVETKELVEDLSEKLITIPTATLITKIMLGVYANTPAVDRFFNIIAKKLGSGIYNYHDGKAVFEKLNKIFKTKEIEEFIATKLDAPDNLVTREKILDAVFFQMGKEKDEKEKKERDKMVNGKIVNK